MTARPALGTALLSALLLAGCGGASAPPAQDAPPPPPAPSTSPAPPPPPPALSEGRDDLIAVKFLEVTENGFPEVEMTNLTDKDIETLRGSFQARDAGGRVVWGTGLTVAVPGQTFLAAGGSRVAVPFGLNRKEDMMEILRSAPDSLSFSFNVIEISYLGQ